MLAVPAETAAADISPAAGGKLAATPETEEAGEAPYAFFLFFKEINKG